MSLPQAMEISIQHFDYSVILCCVKTKKRTFQSAQKRNNPRLCYLITVTGRGLFL